MRYVITMTTSLTRRLERLEARHRPKSAAGPCVPVSALSPTVAALWQTVGMDQMTLAQLNLLEADLRRLTV